MFKRLMATGDSSAALVLRLALGIVLLMHGLQQTLGLFGGKGLTGKLAYYTGVYHIPYPIALFGIISISIGSLLLIIGLWSRVIAFLDGIFLFVAFYTTHIHNGFFMNWEGLKHGEGFEYHILGIGIALAIIIYGGGRASIDRQLTKRKRY